MRKLFALVTLTSMFAAGMGCRTHVAGRCDCDHSDSGHYGVKVVHPPQAAAPVAPGAPAPVHHIGADRQPLPQ